MADRPKLPVPPGEMAPQDLCDRILEWAQRMGFGFSQSPHASEYAKVLVYDPRGGHSGATVPNAHKGRRLKKHQVRYTVNHINHNWRD